jgi:hypothetical protein
MVNSLSAGSSADRLNRAYADALGEIAKCAQVIREAGIKGE